MKILFMGTPELAVPFLEVCARRHQVVGVVTQPDRPSGRHLEVSPTPVKSAALRLNIPVLQPERPSLIADQIRAMGADIAVVVAYGRILKPDVLSAVKLGCLNVHFSLLPKYRGAAPIQWSLIRGESKTGVTLFWIDEGMDTGAIQSRREIEIGPEEDAPQLTQKLIPLGTSLLEETLGDVAQGRVCRQSQMGEASQAPMLTRKDALINFSGSALELHNRIRGLRGGPKAFMTLAGGNVGLLKSRPDPDAEDSSGAEGTLVRVERDRGILVQCSSGRLWIIEVQPEGKRPIQAVDFINGLRLKPGDRLI